MRHEWAIKRVESEINTLRNCLASNEAANAVDATAAKLIAEGVDLASLPESTKEERGIKSRVKDALNVLEATRPFGDAAVERERARIVNGLTSKVAWYEKQAPKDREKIAELEDTLALLKGDRAALADKEAA